VQRRRHIGPPVSLGCSEDGEADSPKSSTSDRSGPAVVGRVDQAKRDRDGEGDVSAAIHAESSSAVESGAAAVMLRDRLATVPFDVDGTS